MIALLLMQKIPAMFLMMLVGFVLVRLKTFRPEESLVLSRIVVLLVMPCVAIKAFQIDYTESVRNGLLLALLAMRSEVRRVGLVCSVRGSLLE